MICDLVVGDLFCIEGYFLVFFLMGGYIYSVLTTYQTQVFIYNLSNPLWEIIPSFIHSFNTYLWSANQEQGEEDEQSWPWPHGVQSVQEGCWEQM